MFGNQHLILSLSTISLLILPIAIETGSFYLLLVLFAAGIGSLLPDIDASDASIFHNKISGTSQFFLGKRKAAIVLNRTIGTFLPFFAYIASWLVYKPYLFVLNYKGIKVDEEHRGIFHSLYAAFLSGIIFALLALIFTVFLSKFNILFAIAFGLGVSAGFVLHLLEDSCTISGVDFKAPFGSYFLSGTLRTSPTEDQSKPNIFIGYIVSLNAIMIAIWFLSQSKIIPKLPFLVNETIVVLLSVGSWLFFLKWCNVTKGNKRKIKQISY